MSLSSTTFIVDDSDSNIEYFGAGWYDAGPSLSQVGTFGPPYNSTSKATILPGNVSFPFLGSSISVYGTTGLRYINTSYPVPRNNVYACLIDGSVIGLPPAPPQPENNQLLCSLDALPDRNHVLTISLPTNIHTTGFAIDYLAFTSSNETSANNYTIKMEQNNSQITYSNGWAPVIESTSVGSLTRILGAQAEVVFTGTKLTWVGFFSLDLPRGPLVGSFVIDNGSPIAFNLPGLPPGSLNTLFNQIIFTTSELSYGSHSVVVTYKGTSTSNTPLVLDYLYIDRTNISSPAEPTLGPIATFSGSSAISSLPTSSSAGIDNSHPNQAGAVAGGIISGVIFLFLVAIVLFWHRRRRRRTMKSTDSDQSTHVPPQKATIIHPFEPTVLSEPNNDPSPEFLSFRPLSNFSEVSGYNHATIEQTRALRKGEEAAMESRDAANENSKGSLDTLPVYGTRTS